MVCIYIRRHTNSCDKPTGYTKGLSLTHLQLKTDDKTSLIPLEVSLCSEPARPFCYVYYYNFEQIKIDAYKRNILSNTIPDPVTMSIAEDTKMSTPEETPKPLIEQVNILL